MSPALSADGETSVMWHEPVLRLAEIMLDEEECVRPGFEDFDAAGVCKATTLFQSTSWGQL